jgi:hypothetical protein
MAKKRAWGTTLSAAQRKRLVEVTESRGRQTVAEAIGINVHTLRTASCGASIQRGTAALIGQWLDKNAAQPAPGRE